jgi:hypothetical protein
MILKKLFFFYIVLLLPAIALFILIYNNILSKTLISFSWLAYLLIYEPLISASRLIQLGVLKRSEFYKIFIPFKRNKYDKVLFFNCITKSESSDNIIKQ